MDRTSWMRVPAGTRLVVLALILILTLVVPAPVGVGAATTFGIGDVFVAVGDGKVQWRRPDGTLHATLDTGLGGFTTGMAFDKAGNLYVTGFTAGAITRFDNAGQAPSSSTSASATVLVRRPRASRTSPVQTATLTTTADLTAGAHHSLAMLADGTLSALGFNFYGQLGDGTTTRRTSPVQVPGLAGVAAIAGGAFFSLTATGGS